MPNRVKDPEAAKIETWTALRDINLDVFSPSNPLPLKIGIKYEVWRQLRGVVGLKKRRLFMRWWTSRPEYIKAVKQSKFRYDLNGNTHQNPQFENGRGTSSDDPDRLLAGSTNR